MGSAFAELEKENHDLKLVGQTTELIERINSELTSSMNGNELTHPSVRAAIAGAIAAKVAEYGIEKFRGDKKRKRPFEKTDQFYFDAN